MPDLNVGDRVKETTSTTGTGTYTLNGAETGFQSFLGSSRIVSGDEVVYMVTDSTDWEVNIGVITTGDTLTRGTLLESSTGSAISWSSGSKDVACVFPAAYFGSHFKDVRTITADPSPGIGDGGVLYRANAASGAFTISLPASSLLFKGFTIAVIKTDATNNAVTIDANGAETINGALTFEISDQYNAHIFVYTGDAADEWNTIADSVDVVSLIMALT